MSVSHPILRNGTTPARRRPAGLPGGALSRSCERGLDLIFAATLLLSVAPLFLLIAVLIRLQGPGPVLFGQLRVGRSGKMFRCFKFRSMVVDAQARLAALLAADPDARAEWNSDHKLKRDPRITRLGAFLRRSSLDELPQLLNVIRGDMSLVGPRPIVPAEIEKYGRWYRYYMQARPGLTGMWQVSGRSDVSYQRRVALDITFVRSWSLGLYFKILFMTIPAVLLRTGSY